MIALTVVNLKMFGKRDFSLNKGKKKKLFCGKFRSITTFRSTRKGKKIFVLCDERTSV